MEIEKLKLVFVGGFLGSGKTTAIQQAVCHFKALNKKVGVITNDQGAQQVDSRLMDSHDIPFEEVADGCFCCNYSTLGNRIATLQASARPEIIFAESVGSCADLAATVINPLLQFNPGRFDIVFSVFADARLLTRFLKEERSVFDDDINYIYGKQIEEADILVVNKIDLLSSAELDSGRQLITGVYRDKQVVFQHALSEQGLGEWIAAVGSDFHDDALRNTLDIDYDRYGAGEASLGWLDEEIGIVSAGHTAAEAGYFFIDRMNSRINEQALPVGHLKFFIDDGNVQQKISFTTLTAAAADHNAIKATDRILILINARVQADPVILKQIVRDCIAETETRMNCKIIENKLSAFRPGYPKPLHRVLC